jgi:hypothetical protein
MMHAIEIIDNNSLPDHQGEHYTTIMEKLHRALQPKTYMEIGTETGQSLAYAQCPSLAIDPTFRIDGARMSQILKRPVSLFFAMKSDAFFRDHDPTVYLKNKIDFAFLDGMHWCEFLLRDFINTEKHCHERSVILLHDCLPVEAPIADRTFCERENIMPHRKGWWTGDVWRTALALKRFRPGLTMTAIDARPTGLVIVSGLEPENTVLSDRYDEIEREMLSWSLDTIGVSALFDELAVRPTSIISEPEKIRSMWQLG